MAQAESPASIPSAQVVGNAFVEQYYQILHQSPELVYRFYQDISVLSRPDVNGVMEFVTTMQGINEKILSMNFKDFVAEIKTADAQQSYEEGVIVLVTGCLTGRDNVRKKFAQSFFLAPQEKGYFVLNDVFRYVDENDSAETNSVSVGRNNENVPVALVTPEQEQPTHVPDHPERNIETSFEEDLNNGPEICDPSDNEDGSIIEEEVVDPPSYSSQSEVINVNSVPSVPQEDAPKKSYASILKAMMANPTPAPVKVSTSNIRVAPPSSDQQSLGTAKPAPAAEASASPVEDGADNNVVQEEVEGHSIYVRNLPLNATAAQLEEVFSKFGPIKQGAVQVRSNKQGFCFGFVEFESSASMKSAIEASPIMIGNRKAVIEEKKTTTRVSAVSGASSGRGRYPSSRGGFRGDSFRSRGNFSGGRGYGRGDFRSSGEFSNRPRGPPGRVTEYYQRVDQNGAGRGGRQVGEK